MRGQSARSFPSCLFSLPYLMSVKADSVTFPGSDPNMDQCLSVVRKRVRVMKKRGAATFTFPLFPQEWVVKARECANRGEQRADKLTFPSAKRLDMDGRSCVHRDWVEERRSTPINCHGRTASKAKVQDVSSVELLGYRSVFWIYQLQEPTFE